MRQMCTFSSSLALVWFWCSLGAGVSPNPQSGICTYDNSVPGLPKAICQFASCSSVGGSDCLAPTITRETAAISISQPWGRWTLNCPSPYKSPCWEVDFSITFRLAATDPSNVKQVGVHLRHEQAGPPEFTKIWGDTNTKDPSGRYVIDKKFLTFVGPGQRLEIAVFELCAKDYLDNEGCVLPLKAIEFKF